MYLTVILLTIVQCLHLFVYQGRDFFDSIPQKVKTQTTASVFCKCVYIKEFVASFWKST